MFFRDIVGQMEAKRQLIASVSEGRVSHAQMLKGPIGSGNLALALAYSRYVLCTNRLPEDSCGACPSCLKVDGLSHPDLHFSFPVILSSGVRMSDHVLSDWRNLVLSNPNISSQEWYLAIGGENKQGVIGKDESENILKKLSYKSYEGGYKIVMMWLPEMMNVAASNKLLKVIEEPPEKTLFLMVAHHTENILPTILSRTQVVSVPRFTNAAIEEYLIERAQLEFDTAKNVASLAEGNLQEAIRITKASEEGSDNFSRFVEWMRLCFKRDVIKAIDWSEEMASVGRERQKQLVLFALNMIRYSIVGNYTNMKLVKIEGEEREFLGKFAKFITNNNIVQLTQELNDAHYHLERNANPKVLFVDLSFKIFKLLKLA